MLVDIDPSAVVSRRLTDTRRRALAQDRGDLGAVETIHVGVAARARRHGSTPTLTPFCDDLEQMRLALELGLADYVRKNGFDEIVVGVSGGIDSALVAALAAEALGPERGALRLDAVALLVRRRRAPTRSGSRRTSAATSARSRSSRWSRRSSRALAPSFAGPRAGSHRGEPAGAHPRRAADGALEQVRLAARRDRQQVGDVGRLRDAVRRHGRRLRAAEGRLQDRRLPARAAPERARRPRADPAVDIDRAPSAELRADQLDEDSLPPYPALDQVLEAYVEDDRTLEELSSGRLRPATSSSAPSR